MHIISSNIYQKLKFQIKLHMQIIMSHIFYIMSLAPVSVAGSASRCNVSCEKTGQNLIHSGLMLTVTKFALSCPSIYKQTCFHEILGFHKGDQDDYSLLYHLTKTTKKKVLLKRRSFLPDHITSQARDSNLQISSPLSILHVTCKGCLKITPSTVTKKTFLNRRSTALHLCPRGLRVSFKSYSNKRRHPHPRKLNVIWVGTSIRTQPLDLRDSSPPTETSLYDGRILSLLGTYILRGARFTVVSGW